MVGNRVGGKPGALVRAYQTDFSPGMQNARLAEISDVFIAVHTRHETHTHTHKARQFNIVIICMRAD